MTNIANVADGNFYFINQLYTIDECFVDCLGGLISSIATDVTISISPNRDTWLKGLKINKAYGDFGMWDEDFDETFSTKIQHLMSGRTKDFVLEAKIPRYTKEITDE